MCHTACSRFLCCHLQIEAEVWVAAAADYTFYLEANDHAILELDDGTAGLGVFTEVIGWECSAIPPPNLCDAANPGACCGVETASLPQTLARGWVKMR